jgi:hypothetical protein
MIVAKYHADHLIPKYHSCHPDVYKPKLEEILNDIIVITEIAELGAEADNLPDATGTMNAKELVEDNLKKRGRLAEVRWSSVKFHNRSRADSDASSIVVEKGDNTSFGDASPIPELPRRVAGTPPRSFMARNAAAPSKSSGLIRIKNLLDRWDEPVNKLDKVCHHFATISTQTYLRL